MAGSQKHLIEVKHWSAAFIREGAEATGAWKHAIDQATKDAAVLAAQGVNRVDWHFTKAMLPADKLDELMKIFRSRGVDVHVFQYS